MRERAGFCSSRDDPLDRANHPLAGKHIVVTRAPEQAGELIRELERLGAKVLILPTVSFAPPADWQQLDEQLRQLDEFDALLFLSKNAVRYIFERSRDLGIKCEALREHKCFIAAVGPATARAAADEGLQVDYIAKNHTGESLVQELRNSLCGKRVLVPRSDRGEDRLPRALQKAGALVTEVVAYRTAVPKTLDTEIVDRVQRADVDAIVFASPSAYHNLSDAMGAKRLAELSSRVDFAAIGPTTARALRETSARVAIEANESSAAGLADAIGKHYQRQVLAKDSRT
jgi:uroporphyrinogen-III synthase